MQWKFNLAFFLRVKKKLCSIRSLPVYHGCQVEPMLSPQGVPQVSHSHLYAHKGYILVLPLHAIIFVGNSFQAYNCD